MIDTFATMKKDLGDETFTNRSQILSWHVEDLNHTFLWTIKFKLQLLSYFLKKGMMAAQKTSI